ncbi:uncharacterized protein LOC105665335 [Ceratitis capitata]|nr:uncharacterized protein LOC105665335 [Ceratitis capitata]
MMTQKANIFKILLLIILLAITTRELQANHIRTKEAQKDLSDANKLRAKREHSTSGGAPNDYGPAIKITSSILQLTKSAAEGSSSSGDIGLQHHETTLEHPWPATSGLELPTTQTVWLELSGGPQTDFHLIAVPDVSNAHIPQAHDFGGGLSGSAPNNNDSGSTLSKGLHTQIISSGKGTTQVSDNLDFGDVAEGKAKGNYRISYGR